MKTPNGVEDLTLPARPCGNPSVTDGKSEVGFSRNSRIGILPVLGSTCKVHRTDKMPVLLMPALWPGGVFASCAPRMELYQVWA